MQVQLVCAHLKYESLKCRVHANTTWYNLYVLTHSVFHLLYRGIFMLYHVWFHATEGSLRILHRMGSWSPGARTRLDVWAWEAKRWMCLFCNGPQHATVFLAYYIYIIFIVFIYIFMFFLSWCLVISCLCQTATGQSCHKAVTGGKTVSFNTFLCTSRFQSRRRFGSHRISRAESWMSSTEDIMFWRWRAPARWARLDPAGVRRGCWHVLTLQDAGQEHFRAFPSSTTLQVELYDFQIFPMTLYVSCVFLI